MYAERPIIPPDRVEYDSGKENGIIRLVIDTTDSVFVA